MNEGKGNTVLLMVIGIATLLVAVIGATFAYFTAVLSGEEKNTTMTIISAGISASYEGGDEVDVSNIYPREEAWGTKTFTVIGNSSGTSNIAYTLGLNVTNNTFSSGALKYTLTVDDTSDANGTKASPITLADIPHVEGEAVELALGNGIIEAPTGGEVRHTYNLSFYFPDTGVEQNDDQGQVLNARVAVSTESSSETVTP